MVYQRIGGCQTGSADTIPALPQKNIAFTDLFSQFPALGGREIGDFDWFVHDGDFWFCYGWHIIMLFACYVNNITK